MRRGTAPGRDDTPAWISRSYGAQVCQRVLLGRVAAAGYGDEAKRAIQDAALALRRCWRARLCALSRAGSAPFDAAGGPPARLDRMFHCAPACYVPAERLHHCGVESLCPDCWARQALACYAGVDALLFPADRPSGRLEGLVLVERRVGYRFRPAVVSPAGTTRRTLGDLVRARLAPRLIRPQPAEYGFLPREQEISRFRKLGVVGGLDVTRVELGQAREGSPRWRFLAHQVLLVPAGRAEALLGDPYVAAGARFFGRPAVVALCHRDEPTRRDLMRVVARAFRYPDFLISGPLELAIECIAARARISRFCRFGRFRGAAP